jgi:hypothetical protein
MMIRASTHYPDTLEVDVGVFNNLLEGAIRLVTLLAERCIRFNVCS